MPDERLNVFPVQDRVLAQVGPSTSRDQPAEHRARAAVDARQPPAVIDVREDEVVGLHDPGAGHVHEVAAENVGRQQHLPGASLEPAGVEGAGVESHVTGREPVDVLGADENIAAAHADLDPGHRRIAAAVQLDDQVFEPAELLAGLVEDGAAPQLRDHQPPLLVAHLKLIIRRVA